MDRPQKTEAEQLQFFNNCLERFNEAAGITGEIKLYYQIAETTVCLNFAGASLLPHLTPALEHLKIEAPVFPDVTINVWNTISTGVQMIPPPCEWADFTDRGDIWGFNSQRIKTAFHWSEYSVNVMDMSANTGVYWVKNPNAFPYWVYSSPFRTMLHWWMEKNSCQLLHAAAVGTSDGAVLITGKGGTGKSTSALTCLNGGMKYLGDDYVIVKKDPEPIVFSLYSTAKLNVEDLDRFSALMPFVGERVKDDQEKEVLFLYPALKDQIDNQMPLKAILTPQIQKTENTSIEPASFWPIQRAMSFTTMSQLPGVGPQTQEYISGFISKLPCYTLKPGNIFSLIPKTIIDFLENPEKYSDTTNPQTSESPNPLISIIIPVFNGEKFIKQAIQNIINQNYPAIEILIVDDGSTDSTCEVVENLTVDVRYFHQPNSGPASARNRAIRDISGDFIAFLDVDDLWPEKNLELLMKELLDNPDLDLVRGYAQLFSIDEAGKMEYLGNPKESFPDYIGAGLYRKQAFAKVGLYDAELRFGEDGDWFNRAAEKKIVMKRLDEVTLFVQRHVGNMTKGKSLVELNTLKVFKKKLERKRSGTIETEEPEIKKTVTGNPKISVIIPVYNGAAFISEAIESVFDQQYEPLELIIIDDGSTDNTAEMVKMTGHDISYFYQKRKGPAAARNQGIELATGKFVAFLDADDVWAKNKLSRQTGILGNKPDIEATIGFTHKIQMSLKIEDATAQAKDSGLFMLSLGASLFRKNAFVKVGKFDETLQSGEDIDWFLRAREAEVQIIIHKEIVQFYRSHGRNISNNQALVNLSLLKIHKKSLNRRKTRGQGAVLNLPKLNNVEDVLKFWQSND